jgi:chromosome segregation ATPase
MKTVEELEKEFYVQRDGILKQLNKKEDIIRKDLSKLTAQLSVFKKKRAQLQAVENRTKKNLNNMQKKLGTSKTQVRKDENTVKFMKKRIIQLRREIPVIERNIKKMTPQKNRIAKAYQRIDSKLRPVNKMISKKQAEIKALKAKISKLDSKENFIRRGAIVWGEFKPKRKIVKKPRKKAKGAKKPQEPPKKKSFLGIFSLKK